MLWTSTRKFLANIQPSSPHAWSITDMYCGFPGDPTEMMVTWVTLAYTNYTVVEYNKAGFPLTLQAAGDSTKFTDGGSEHRVLYIHRVKITGLVPDQMYGKYHAGFTKGRPG